MIERTKRRLRWPQAARKQQSVKHVEEMLLFDDIIKDDFGQDHINFKELLKFMLKLDPNKRPSASECLKHPFF